MMKHDDDDDDNTTDGRPTIDAESTASIRLFAYAWSSDDDAPDGTAIRVYGVDEGGATACVRITNFTPYVYIELRDAGEYDRVLRAVYPAVLETRLVWKQHLYATRGCGEDTRPFMFCRCASRRRINELVWMLRDKFGSRGSGGNDAAVPRVHEKEASAILQLIALRNLSYTGWLKIPRASSTEEVAPDATDRQTRCSHEYITRWRALDPCDTTDGGEDAHLVDVIPPPKTLAFDFEVNSELKNAMPDDRPDDAIFQISCVTTTAIPGKLKTTLLTLRDAASDRGRKDPSDAVDRGRTGDSPRELSPVRPPAAKPIGRQASAAKPIDALAASPELSAVDVVRQFDDELALIRAFLREIVDEQPMALLGYNVLGFDLPYLIRRCERYRIVDELRAVGFNAAIPSAVRAYGDCERAYVDWEGVVIFDLLPMIQRDHRLHNYKLSTVASVFLNAAKDPVTVKQIFAAYRDRSMAVVGKYCVQDSRLCVDLFDYHSHWIAYAHMSRICNVSMFALHSQGQQIKIYSLIYKYCLRENVVVDSDGFESSASERYRGAYVMEPRAGEYADVMPFDFASLYPSIMQAYNICYSTFAEEARRDDECHVFEWEDHVACKHDPSVVRHEALSARIAAMDATINAEMAARDAVARDEAALRVPIAQRSRAAYQRRIDALRDAEKPLRAERVSLKRAAAEDDSGYMCAKRRYRFVKSDVRVGVVPTILKRLLARREEIKTALKTCTDARRRVVLDKQQLAYKVTANSVYGLMGVRRGLLPFMPAAMCVTYVGRQAIDRLRGLISDRWRGETIYGDTDSNYVIFPDVPRDALWDHALKVADDVSTFFPAPMRLEFEKARYSKFLILCKKRYVYRAVDAYGVPSPSLGIRGVVLARRNVAGVVRRAYERVVELLFDDDAAAAPTASDNADIVWTRNPDDDDDDSECEDASRSCEACGLVRVARTSSVKPRGRVSVEFLAPNKQPMRRRVAHWCAGKPIDCGAWDRQGRKDPSDAVDGGRHVARG
jgi:DNA polymerase elongation subunit (family B)